MIMLLELQPEQGGHFDRHGRGHCKAESDDDVCLARRSHLSGIGRHEQELVPETVRVRARELPRAGVVTAQALYGDQERFIGRKTGLDETRNLLAQTILKLHEIDGGVRLLAAEIAPPSFNLLLDRYRVM